MLWKPNKDDIDGVVTASSGYYAKITGKELLKHIAYENKRRKLFKIWVWRGRKGQPPK
jgi:hypothetical protein